MVSMTLTHWPRRTARKVVQESRHRLQGVDQDPALGVAQGGVGMGEQVPAGPLDQYAGEAGSASRERL
jgi:hypothetical protein